MFVPFACISLSCVIYFEPSFLSSIFPRSPSGGKHAKIVQKMYDCNKANSVSFSPLFFPASLLCSAALCWCCVCLDTSAPLGELNFSYSAVQCQTKETHRISRTCVHSCWVHTLSMNCVPWFCIKLVTIKSWHIISWEASSLILSTSCKLNSYGGMLARGGTKYQSQNIPY